MVGSAHTRRLATIVLAGVFILGASGCYVGNSTTYFGAFILTCPLGVDLGPGKITVGDPGPFGGLWQAAPTAVSIQFAVMSSDSPNPITVDVRTPNNPPPSFGVVWDGTRPSGTKSTPLVLTPTGSPPFFLYAYALPQSAGAHLTWWLTARDAAGNEVGFTCTPAVYV